MKGAVMRHLSLTLRVACLILVLPVGHAFGPTRAAHAAASSCTQGAPGVTVENTWAWASTGSWGMPGQQLAYQIQVTNNDIGCSSSSFLIDVSPPAGFSHSIPTNTISLKSSSSGYLWAYVTSPTVIADGDYSLTVAVQRAGTSTSSASFTTYYKIYSSDTIAPTLFWPNPGDGQTISGTSYHVVVSSNDDHAVKHIDLYIDNVYVSTTACDNISYNCHLAYKWALRGVHGQHTATFKSYDWMGNVGILTVSFTVS
jgi:hypothetical protein